MAQLNDDNKTTLKTRNLNRWIRKVSGDLDKIVLKALQFDVSQRYFTVMELIDDLNRYRRKMPVLAQNPSLYYVVNKFVVRNSFFIALFLILFAFSFYTLNQKLRLDEISRDLQIRNRLVTLQRDKADRQIKTMKNLAKNLSTAHYSDPLNVGKQNLIINDTVNIATGYMYYEEVLEDHSDKFDLKIFYNSNYALQTRAWGKTIKRWSSDPDSLIKYSLGKGWNHNYFKAMNANWSEYDKNIYFYRDDGRVIEFNKKNDQWNNRYKTGEVLHVNEKKSYDEQYFVTTLTNGIEKYQGRFQNKLISITDEKGTLSMQYKRYGNQLQQVQADNGESIKFSYINDDKQVVKTTIKNRSWEFQYDLFDNLTQIKYPDGNKKLFGYLEDKHLLKTVGFQNKGLNNNQYTLKVSYLYDHFHRVNRVKYHHGPCENEVLRIKYNNDRSRTVTNTQGLVNHYRVEKFDGVWKVTDQKIEFEYQDCQTQLLK